MIKDNQQNKHGEELFSLTMDMDTKRRIQVLAIIGLFGIAFLWMYGLSQTSAPDIPTIYATAAVPPDQKKVVLKNLGMSCVFCKAAVSAKLKQVPGVITYDVDLKSDSATVLYDPGKVDIEGLKRAIAEAGFQVRAVEEVDR